jgi:NAD(P)-dependent dehydrogenase (short-subunit alcohol dehydrogenase family)
MAGRLQDKVALITGAGSGIGLATARAFVAAGARVVVSDRDVEAGERAARGIEDSGGSATFVPCDVTDPAQVEALVKKTVEVYGRLDCAHNNAGIASRGGRGRTADVAEADWDAVIAVNLKGVWLCMKYELPQMLAQGGGAIVNTASIAGMIGIPGASAYVASKHGVAGLTRTAALEYSGAGVRINAVCPGYIDTPLISGLVADPGRRGAIEGRHPIGRLGTPEEVAGAVVWLCSDAASFVTGSLLTVDGGYVAQ